MSNEIVYQLVRTILTQAGAFTWSLQGLGMLRLHLNQSTRLHVWDSQFRIANVSPVHDHPWDFESYVVVGRVRQKRYLSDPNGMPFRHARIRCGAGACVVSSVNAIKLKGKEETFSGGVSYKQLAHEIHESYPEDGTVTLCRRVFGTDSEHANVFWQGDGNFVSAEPRPATREEITAITSRALNQWFTP